MAGNFADYVLLGELGRGKDGRVFKAMSPQGVVALKVPHADARAQYRHALEAEHYEHLGDHPALARLIDRGRDPPFLALDYCAGGSIAGRRPSDRIVNEVRAHAQSLHAHGLYLPTMGPDDVLLTRNGQTRLCDLAAIVPLTPLARHELEPLLPAVRGRGWMYDPLNGPDAELPYELLRRGVRKSGAVLRGEVAFPMFAEQQGVRWHAPTEDVSDLLAPGYHSIKASESLAVALGAHLSGRVFVIRLPRNYCDDWFAAVLLEQVRIKARLLTDAALRSIIPTAIDAVLLRHHHGLARRVAAKDGANVSQAALVSALQPCTIVRLIPSGLAIPPMTAGIDLTDADTLLHPSSIVGGELLTGYLGALDR